MMEENKNLRKMANADEATKLRAELRAAKERIPTLEVDLKKVEEYAIFAEIEKKNFEIEGKIEKISKENIC
jgi:hypothetical protein